MVKAMNEQGYTYRYPHPAVTADTVLFGRPVGGREVAKVLLIERRRYPYAGHWAFPGGFMNIDETTEAAARRELAEETGLHLDAANLKLHRVGVYDAVARDPRERVLTVAYAAEVPQCEDVEGRDDAADARWWPLDALPPLAFDHAEILRDACRLLGYPEPHVSPAGAAAAGEETPDA